MKPIFIAGCDRSGTTLAGNILGRAQNAVTTPESQFIYSCFPNATNRDEDKKRVITAVRKNWRYKIWGLSASKWERSALQSRRCEELILSIVMCYAQEHGKGDADFWIDHTPSHVRYFETLFDIFPECKIVHMVRDGRAVASSLMQVDWGPNSIPHAAAHWIDALAYGLAMEHKYPHAVMRVHYEDLVRKPEKTIRAMCDFAHLPYNDSMMQQGDARVPAYTRKQHALVGGKIDPGRAVAWKKNLSQREIGMFEYLTFDMLAHLGYTKVSTPYYHRPPQTIEMVTGLLYAGCTYVLNKIRRTWRYLVST